MMSLHIFGFHALWSPYYLFVLLLILTSYYIITLKNTFSSGDKRLTKRQGISFTVAIFLLYAIKGSPLDLMGHVTFSAHMTQMAILYLVIPPLLIIGIPQWLWKVILYKSTTNKVFKFFTKPIIALILFNGVFSFYHIPIIFDFVKTDMWLHASYTTILFILALFMWWPLVTQLEEYDHLNGLKKVGYIFADGILLTPACALIIFADTPLYSTYTDSSVWVQALELCVPLSTLGALELSGPEMFNSMSPIQDQQTGGVLMKVIQEIIYGVVLGHIFFSWYRKEHKELEEYSVKSKGDLG